MRDMTERPPLLKLIGNTPLIDLEADSAGSLFGKPEFLNPGGSVKDRAALFMVEDAERQGVLKPGGTIVEGSSGNQGIALAMIGAVKGYRVVIVVPKHTSEEKKAALRAYGAEVHITADTATHADPESYHSVALKLAAAIPGAYMPDQFYNLQNVEAHYQTTGPEIWEQTDGTVTHFICGMGSCGTISGVGRYLKEQNPKVQIIGADSAHSLLSAENPQPYETEGIGVDIITDVLDQSVIDQVIPTHDEEAFQTARRYSTRGLLVGPSSGAALSAAEKTLPSLSEGDVAVCLLPDSGRAYLSKLFSIGLSDEEIAQSGLSQAVA